MTQDTNQKIVLASRPEGAPSEANFRLEHAEVPEPGDGEVLLQTVYLSLDPYMRGRMSAAKSYADPVEIGQVMVGSTVNRVLTSRHPDYAEGDVVLGNSGWQTYSVARGEGLRKLDPAQAPVSSALSVLGMTGLTAYVGLLNIGKPQAGETVVVSSAAGAVGSVVGQIAKLRGCRVVGVAGTQEKNAYLKTLGFDESLNYKADNFADELAAACPDGVDVYFENVGGGVFEAVLPLLNVGARVPVCGLIAHYNQTSLPGGPNQVPQLMSSVLTKRLLLQGFIVGDHFERLPDFTRDMSGWVKTGEVKYKEDIVEGLKNAPRAFIELLSGGNFGKLLVEVSAPPH